MSDYEEMTPYWFGRGKPKCDYKQAEADAKQFVLTVAAMVWSSCQVLGQLSYQPVNYVN